MTPQLVEGARVAEMVERARQEAYEQAAKWCEERARKMADRALAGESHDPERLLAAADWVAGCADTIRFNAGRARGGPSGGDTR